MFLMILEEGFLIPIPKETGCKGTVGVDQFRGITISPIISKLFEHCALKMFKDYLHTSSRQLGFKKRLGCAHAIFSVRSVIDYYVSNDSTVNVCCLDISKAFDKVCHSGLLLKLLNRGVPICLVLILQNWFSKSFCTVKWNNTFSQSFQILAGVRQGGVLSPILFSVYVDSILIKLQNRGCFLQGLNLGSLMYADDLVLLASSVSELQDMINICCNELVNIDLKLNEKSQFVFVLGNVGIMNAFYC